MKDAGNTWPRRRRTSIPALQPALAAEQAAYQAL